MMEMLGKVQSCWECWLLLAIVSFLVAVMLEAWAEGMQTSAVALPTGDARQMNDAAKGLKMVAAIAALVAMWGYMMPMKHHYSRLGGLGSGLGLGADGKK